MLSRRLMMQSGGGGNLPQGYKKVGKIRSNNLSFIDLPISFVEQLLGNDKTLNDLQIEFSFIPYTNGGLFGYYDTYAQYNYDIRIENSVLTFARGLHFLHPKNSTTKNIELGIEHSVRINGSSIYVDDEFLGEFKLDCGEYFIVNNNCLALFAIANWRGGRTHIDASIGDMYFVSGNGTPYSLLTCEREDGKVGMYEKENDMFLFDSQNNFTIDN